MNNNSAIRQLEELLTRTTGLSGWLRYEKGMVVGSQWSINLSLYPEIIELIPKIIREFNSELEGVTERSWEDGYQEGLRVGRRGED